MKKLILSICLTLSTLLCFAQEGGVEMADELRKSGKIYVVVAVLAVIFLGLAFYLFAMDRRLKKLENNKS